MADNYVDLYYDVDTDAFTAQEGLELHGKDGVFCTSPLYTDIPLLTKAQSVAEAINELFYEGTGVLNGSLRAVIDDKTGAINIVAGEVPEGEAEESYTDYNYTYTAVDFSEEIKTEKASGDTTTTQTQKFIKRIITEVKDSADNIIMTTDYDANTGEIKGFYDGNGLAIYLAEWRT